MLRNLTKGLTKQAEEEGFPKSEWLWSPHSLFNITPLVGSRLSRYPSFWDETIRPHPVNFLVGKLPSHPGGSQGERENVTLTTELISFLSWTTSWYPIFTPFGLEES